MRFLNRRKQQYSSKKSPVIIKIVVLLVLLIVLLICWNVGTKVDYCSTNVIPESIEDFNQQFPNLTPSKIDRNISTDSETEIDLNSATDQVTISTAGDYICSGELDGRIVIDAKDDTVHLFLNGATIKSSKGPALIVENAYKVIITLVSDTQNCISDSNNYSDEKYEACIYSNCDLTLNGTGSLEVYGIYKDAIRSKDILRIIDGNYRIHSKRTAIRGNDGINICSGNIFIGSEKYGLKTTKTGIEDRGNLVVSGGELSIVAGEFGFVTDNSNLYIFDCSVSMNCVLGNYRVKGAKVIQDGCVK